MGGLSRAGHIYKILLETESIEYTQTKKSNLTRNQRIALANFSKRTDILINKADKKYSQTPLSWLSKTPIPKEQISES